MMQGWREMAKLISSRSPNRWERAHMHQPTYGSYPRVCTYLLYLSNIA